MATVAELPTFIDPVGNSAPRLVADAQSSTPSRHAECRGFGFPAPRNRDSAYISIIAPNLKLSITCQAIQECNPRDGRRDICNVTVGSPSAPWLWESGNRFLISKLAERASFSQPCPRRLDVACCTSFGLRRRLASR